VNIDGSKWTARNGSRSLVVLHELSQWRGERQFMVEGVESGRKRHIGYGGLLRAYRRDTEGETES
jgi:hypothetical protein